MIEESQLVSCEICGVQDDTIRYARYPFVISLVFFTFQREFIGHWCRWHRIQLWLEAGIITSLFGWFGIPFGLFYTPARLYELARGGFQNKDRNTEFLLSLARKRLVEGDYRDSITCLEHSLHNRVDTVAYSLLKELYASQSIPPQPTRFMIAAIFGTAPVLMGALGFFAGLTENQIVAFINSLSGNATWVPCAVAWISLTSMFFLLVALLRCVIEWTVRTTNLTNSVLAIGFTTFSAILFPIFITIGWNIGAPFAPNQSAILGLVLALLLFVSEFLLIPKTLEVIEWQKWIAELRHA